jgi:hypothetical protein
MFGSQIRQAGLVVASLALTVAVLVGPAAPTMAQEASDSIETIPVSLNVGEAEEVQGVIKLPPTMFADIEIVAKGKTISTSGNTTTYSFRAKNLGPGQANGVMLTKFAVVWDQSGNYVGIQNHQVWYVNMAPGAEIPFSVSCTPPAGTYCHDAKGAANFNTDLNLGNNSAEIN